jgi:hypothetical protein
MGLKDFIVDVIKDVIVTTKNATSLESTTREGRFAISVVMSMMFFFTFFAISGDLWVTGGITAGLEIVLLYTMSVL